jgi:hypothetical protein
LGILSGLNAVISTSPGKSNEDYHRDSKEIKTPLIARIIKKAGFPIK